MIIFWIIVAILLFTIIVIVHELGHFSAARIFWVKVEEFWVGIPPRAKKLFLDKKGTLFSLNWLPLWWFVRLKWENKQWLQNKEDPEALINKKAYQQSVIVLAGIFMNFVLAIFIFSIVFMIGIKPIGINTQIKTEKYLRTIPTYEQAIKNGFLIKEPWVILQPINGSIAEQSGIETWNLLVKINNETIEAPNEVIKKIQENWWKEISFTLIQKDNTQKVIQITPTIEWKIGSYLSDNIIINENFEYKYPPHIALKIGIEETYNHISLTFQWLWMILRKIFLPESKEERQEALSQVSWPIGVVDFVTKSLERGFVFLLILWAIISINLWVFNLLPIPALDGWRFVLIVINSIVKKIFGKKAVNEKWESIIHAWFFILLIALSVIIMYNDINRIINN